MKGGDVLALGVLRALAERAHTFAEVALLLVCDEEWRAGDFAHTARFAGWDACLCFEGGQLTDDGEEAVVVKRKAAGTLRVLAHGRSAHSGSAPEKGANALLALASAAQSVAALHDPAGPAHLTVGADRRAQRRRVQRRARRRRALVRPARRRARHVRHRPRRAAGRGRRRAPGSRVPAPLAGNGRPRGHGAAARRRRRSASAARSTAPTAAARATPATSRRSSRSPSTDSARGEEAPTLPANTSSSRRCESAPRWRWRSRTPCSHRAILWSYRTTVRNAHNNRHRGANVGKLR